MWPSDRLLENIATKDAGPEDEVVSMEATELAFRVAARHLPPIARETVPPEQSTARACSRCPRSVLARPAVYPFKERTEPEGDPHETLHAEARLR
jgi:hypothetical protein